MGVDRHLNAGGNDSGGAASGYNAKMQGQGFIPFLIICITIGGYPDYSLGGSHGESQMPLHRQIVQVHVLLTCLG